MSGTAARRFRTVVVSPDIPDNADERIKEGAARRRLVATTGRCPCGAVLTVPDLAPGTVTVMAVEHEPDCPAITPGSDASTPKDF